MKIELQLQNSEQVSDIVERVVLFSEKLNDSEMDFSALSLRRLDQLLDEYRDVGVDADQHIVELFQLGCYLGEVFVRNSGARWVAVNEDSRHFFNWTIYLVLPSGRYVDPVEAIYHRMNSAIGECVASYFSRLDEQAA